MKIRILKRIGKTLDGVRIGEYIQDKEYEVQEDLAKIFIESGIAEEVKKPVSQFGVDTQSTEEKPVSQEEKAVSHEEITVSEPVSKAKEK